MKTFDFMGHARLWVLISLVVTLIGLASLSTGLVSSRPGLNLGIDFTGGLLLDLRFDKADLATGDLRTALGETPGRDATVQKTEVTGDKTGSEFLVRMPEISEEDQDKMFTELETKLGTFEKVSIAKVSPTIREELIRGALLALFIAAALQILYITVRFEFRFGVTAVIALLHDALITLGLMSLFRVEVGPAFVAAILTVIGYSVNDTIIIFDRIRENMRRAKRGEDLAQLVNTSIGQTLSRSIITVVTTLFAVVAILFFGGASTREFALALLIGILSGTYSSIFIASPLWLWWRQRGERGKFGRKPRTA